MKSKKVLYASAPILGLAMLLVYLAPAAPAQVLSVPPATFNPVHSDVAWFNSGAKVYLQPGGLYSKLLAPVYFTEFIEPIG